MGLFKCEKCGCVENTALGLYWNRSMAEMFEWPNDDVRYQRKPLCSECAPVKFRDGTLTRYGKWHNKFPKRNIYTLSEAENVNIYNA